MMNRCCPAPPAWLTTAGARLTGAVTQTGVLLDGGYRYEVLQDCSIRVAEVNGLSVVCEVDRTENRKWVNGLSEDDEGAKALPPPLRAYLQTSRRSGCSERATGVYDPFTRVLRLRGEWPSSSHAGGGDTVLWSPHIYTLLVSQQGLAGTVFCNDGMADRQSGVGSLWAAVA
jgi:hypothetical protein